VSNFMGTSYGESGWLCFVGDAVRGAAGSPESTQERSAVEKVSSLTNIPVR